MNIVNGRFDQAAGLFYFQDQVIGVPAKRALGKVEKFANTVFKQWLKVQILIDGQAETIYVKRLNPAQFRPISEEGTPTPTSRGSEATSPVPAIEIPERVQGIYDQHPDILGGVTPQEFATIIQFIDRYPAAPNEEFLRSADTGLARTIYKDVFGNFYIVMNKLSRGDKMVEAGAFKKVSFVLRYIPGDDQATKYVRYTPKKPHHVKADAPVSPTHFEAVVPAFRKELDFLARLNGCEGLPNLEMQGELESKKIREMRPFLIVPFYNSGDGIEFLQQMPIIPLTPQQRIDITRDILNALRDVHRRGIFHRDIKLENFFLHTTLDGRVHAVLADFGLACNAGDDIEILRTLCGSPQCLNPDMKRLYDELINPEIPLRHREQLSRTHRYQYVAADDVWGVGSQLINLFYYRVPSDEYTDEGFTTRYAEYLTVNPHLPEARILSLLQRMAAPNRLARPTAEQAVLELEQIIG
jgi:serine/threonine protein kinase